MKILKPTIAFGFIIFALAACNLISSSPTATFKSFYEAQKKKDVDGMKKTLSKSSIQMIETAAKAQGKTVDKAESGKYCGSEGRSEAGDRLHGHGPSAQQDHR